MKNTLKTASFSSFAWTILLIVLLACFTVVLLVGNKKTHLINSNINTLKEEDTRYQKLDSCVSILYDAENNSRLFVLTLDSAYLHKYMLQLTEVSNILSRFEDQQNKNSSQLSSLLRKKRVTNQEFVNLKVMVDSLLFYTLNQEPERAVKLKKKPVVVKTTKQTVLSDTSLAAAKKSKRKLLKRIADAISNKDDKDTNITHLAKSTITIRDSVILPKVSTVEGNDPYKQFYSARRALNEREKQLLVINGRIFANLQSTLKDLKFINDRKREAHRKALLTKTAASVNEVRDLSLGSVGVVLILTMMIIWNLIRLYKKEVTILNHADLTAETSKLKGVFMAQVAHEIRTPLNSVIGFSELIDTRKLDDDLKVNINAIKSSSKILLTLVNEILDFSKFESSNITLRNMPISPLGLLKEAVNILSVLAAEKSIVVSTDFGFEPSLKLLADEFRIKQIVINLLTNAIKFTPVGGHVNVTAGFEKNNDETGFFLLKVKDSGVGIAPENQERIFEDFIQIDMVDNASHHLGTGLGLAICKKITDLYGGKITVSSILGQGSEFRVEIPVKIAAHAGDVEKNIVRPFSRSILKGKKVLIVDDSRINLILISKIMDKYGVGYDLAENGKKAYDLFEAGPYDLIITDIQMPVMDGITLTHQIRKHPDKAKSNIPVMGFTGSSSEENKEHLISVGMNEVLSKPFAERDLLEMLIDLLSDKSNF